MTNSTRLEFLNDKDETVKELPLTPEQDRSLTQATIQATHELVGGKGTLFKKGIHGFMFMYHRDECQWRRCNVESSEIISIHRRIKLEKLHVVKLAKQRAEKQSNRLQVA